MGRDMLFGIFPYYFVYTIIIILVIAAIFYWLVHTAKRKETPIDILKKRYAAGEIDRETFIRMKEELAE